MFWIARTAYLFHAKNRLQRRCEGRGRQLDRLHGERSRAGAGLLLGAGLAVLWPPALLLLLPMAARLGQLAGLEGQLHRDDRRESAWSRSLHDDLRRMRPERHREALWRTGDLSNPVGRAHLRAWAEKEPRWRPPLEAIEHVAECHPPSGRELLRELLVRREPAPLVRLAAARLGNIEPRPVVAELARQGSKLSLRFLALQAEGSRTRVFRCLIAGLAGGRAPEDILERAARLALDDPTLLEALMEELACYDPRVRAARCLHPPARWRAYREILI